MNFNREQLRSALTSPDDFLAYSFGCTSTMGFGADFLGLLSKIMGCLQSGVGFRLGRVSHPKGFVVSKGWTDYFEPFCEEVEAPFIERLNRGNFPYARKLPIIKPSVRLWLRAFSCPRARYFAFDNLLRPEELGPPAFEHGEDYITARKDLANLLWHYNDETAEEVQEFKKEHDLENGRYVAICVRRGDKKIEHDYVEIEAYVRLLRGLEFSIDEVFVATDDFSVVTEISKLMPEIHFVSITDNQSSGYVHRDFKMLPASERRRQTVRFFAQLEFLRDAACFVGSKTTNVAWLANALMGGERVMWVD